MPFRATFDCLWCGNAWTARGPDDLEGWAQLCPTCLGKAGENDFLRYRLRRALDDRAAGTAVAVTPARAGTPPVAAGHLERGEIVELAAGTGWWTPLLAEKGELWAYDAAQAPLDLARERLLAHGLRAHLHLRDAWSEPDRQVDALFAGFWLSHVARGRLDAFLALARRWLKPGGTFAFVDSRPDPQSGAADHHEPGDDHAMRRLADGREFRIVKVYYEPAELRAALTRAGFAGTEITTTGRFFLLGRGSVPEGSRVAG